MSAAIALASLIVMSDLAVSLARRTNYVNRRVAALNAIVRSLRHETVVEQRKLGTVREQASAGEVFEKILFATDLRTIKLATPIEKDRAAREKSTAQSSGIDLPAGKLAMSESASAAILEVSGLKSTPDLRGLPYLVDSEARECRFGPRTFWLATTVSRWCRWTCRRIARRKCRSVSPGK